MDRSRKFSRPQLLLAAAPVGALFAALGTALGYPVQLIVPILLAVTALTIGASWRAAASARPADWIAAMAPLAGDLLAVLDADALVSQVVIPTETTLGFTGADLEGRHINELLPRAVAARVEAAITQARRRPGTPEVLRTQVRTPSARWREAEITFIGVRGGGVLFGVRDMSQQSQLEGDLMRQAYSDPLTGLANRSLFQTRVQQAVRDASGPKKVAVLFVDLDGFKSVNDTLGHAVGDSLLIEVARRLLDCVRHEDLVARLGGDEFAVLVTGDSADRTAIEVAERIVHTLPRNFTLAGRDISPGGSTGVAIADTGHETAEQLLRNADLAMYRAKSAGDSGYVRYEEHMHRTALERVQAESDLRQAIASGDLVLHYQPVVNLATGAIVGVEALVRWVHASRGLLSPGTFIDLAEETGLVREIGAWAIETACRDAMRWQRYAPPGATFHVSVNVSARQLGPDLIDTVRAALRTSGVQPGVLMLEVTESVFADAPDEAAALLRRLRSEGVKIALDDFGTGYSSLSYLTRLPVDVLKIDKSFVRHLGGQQRTGPGELTRTILQLCRSLHLGAIAEGVENPQQREALVRMGCGFAQGFLFAAAMRADAIDEVLAGGAQMAKPIGLPEQRTSEDIALPAS